ncbi:hypothetical protein [Lederbergia graminis]|uniref:Uncharacterized protein n=1 Tax=Lederbergia graminis TaxID=735518 RepID=A0ABW0LL02_9BACI
MEIAVIYLRQKENESVENFLISSDKFILSLKKKYIVITIIADYYNENGQLYNFINSTKKNLDVLILDHLLNDEFDIRLIKEVARMENFRVDFIKRNTDNTI